MSESGLSSIGVIGIGVMGNGIAQVTAQSGFSTIVMDVNEELLKKGVENIGRSLDRLVSAYEKSGGEKGITAEAKAQAVARLSTTTTLDGLLGCDLIIEAVPERPELKEEINRKLAGVGYDKILVSNTSGISITRLGAAYGKPDRFMGMHFMTRCRSNRGSRSSAAWRPPTRPTPRWWRCAETSARSRSRRRTRPASRSTGCSCPSSTRRSGSSRKASPRSTTSTSAPTASATRWAP